jgi:hypothetical protein
MIKCYIGGVNKRGFIKCTAFGQRVQQTAATAE